MTVVELHPEQLIDKELLGTLSADERQRLDGHFASCPVCRLERLARGAFRSDFAAEAHRGNLAQMVSLAVGVARRAAAVGGEGQPGGWPPVGLAATAAFPPSCLQDGSTDVATTDDAPSDRTKGKPSISRRARLGVLMAAALLLASIIAAAWPEGRRVFGHGGVSTPTDMGRAPTLAQPTLEQSRAAAASEAILETAVGSRATPVPLLSPGAPLPKRASAAAHERLAATIFAEANDALGQRSYAKARALYAELETRYPRSPEARTALGILGRLALDAHQPAAALRYFDDYLTEGAGALGEEASVGRALALERLGHSDEAGAAWSSLLIAYPTSAHAAHARERIAVLGER
ncbi:MAG: zf-HC2 domain-containing protein [Myxococcota bacterium]|nr:zf-HC2 domain-containing protein [Myxococcota bacterium]